MVQPLGRFLWERAVRDDDQLPFPAKGFAFLLATYADSWGERIFPGVDRLVLDTGLHRSSVMRHIDALVQSGWLTLVKAGNRRAGQANMYRLTCPDNTVIDDDEVCGQVGG